jgi:hypothetical protein
MYQSWDFWYETIPSGNPGLAEHIFAGQAKPQSHASRRNAQNGFLGEEVKKTPA